MALMCLRTAGFPLRSRRQSYRLRTAEHAVRYARLADALNAAGYAVYANDHRGHGRSVKSADDLGLFAEREGWRKCVADMWQLNRHIAATHPGLPIVLLGHSMGATLAEQFIGDHGDALAGVVLSGANGKPTLLVKIGGAITGAERAGRASWSSRSPLTPSTKTLRPQGRRSIGSRVIQPRWINM